MRISLFSWIFLNSFIAVFISINVVCVSAQCQSDQRQLLLKLKRSLNSTSLGKLVKWNHTTDCCSWDGVSCDEGGRVIGLNLSNQSISGAIENSSSLFSLKHLQRLDLSYNRLSSAFPSGFDKFANLSYLNLSNAGFKGQIPAEISSMTRLVTLDLSVSLLLGRPLKLEKPNLKTLVQNLPRLRFLHLDGVYISARGNEWCQALSSLTSLEVLSMSNCNLSGPIDSSFSKLRSLTVIRLDNNNLSAPLPKFFAEFLNLTSLRLTTTRLRGRLPEEILQAPTLQILDLSSNKLLSGSFRNFSLNASLQTLVLSDTKFGGQVPESIGNLGQLTRIELARCNFTGPIPDSILKLTNLVYLDFSSNNFSGPMPSFSSSRNLTQQNLAHNQLNGTIQSTDWSGLSKLVSIDLRNNKFSGTIPTTLFRIPSLQKILLSQNQFGGNLRLGDLHGEAYLLDTLDLSSNKLQGPLPESVFELQGLKILSLASNNFSGFIPLSAIQNLRNLSSLDLSHNRLSINASAINPSLPSFPNITTLKLASCNLMKFPDFLKDQNRLVYLDLSNNNIHGEIPKWIWEARGLLHLNLSQNFLVEFEGPLQNITSTLSVLDLHGNQLQGKFSFFPQDATYLDYSNNNFSSDLPAEIGDYLNFAYFFSLSSNNFQGSIPSSICNSTYLQVLDLSNNSLSGGIPECLTHFSMSLGVLNLRRNNLSGVISDTFPQDCGLQTLDLNRNLLQGKVPKSLANCKMLEVLDLGNNQINDTFPCHLKNISRLRVLVLRANKFNGNIHCPEKSPWPVLQIVDLASNSFSGRLHYTCLLTWKAMQTVEDEAQSKLKHLQFEILQLNPYYYKDAITVTMKGLELELLKILTVFTSIDISCNNFEGPIPEVIGSFKALYVLNLSHNAFTGSIPSVLGNLRQLESLDLSSNNFHGEIPFQLANLNFLAFLNVSNNKLMGRIPTTTLLQSFAKASFENNAGLCGPPLKRKCQLPPAIKQSSFDSRTRSHIHWNFISAEIGFFFGFGIVITPLIFWKRWRIWYYKRIDLALIRLLPWLVLEIRKHGSRANWNQRRRL
ncbi:receptor-like protein 12 [Durio zibethinus]|uniref:Receptor-like protein 12 n=1 Tax=Durio zibethinus TaxID=66656 RepID=A0A6P6ASH8_DURZI|nr:receptor-like protein 12 [Durio zibethinus]